MVKLILLVGLAKCIMMREEEEEPLTINIQYNNNEIAEYDTLWP